MDEPRVIAETGAYVVVYKPPRMHSAPLAWEGVETLLDWCCALYPDLRKPRGRLAREGGLVHRLDFETSGLVLIARTQEALNILEEQQKLGLFIKEYEAMSAAATAPPLPGFPKESPLSGGAAAGSFYHSQRIPSLRPRQKGGAAGVIPR